MQKSNNTTNEEEVRESIFRNDFEEWCKNEGMSTQRNPMISTLWSKRNSVAKGNHWVQERTVREDEAQEWLKIFRAAEPDVLFLVSKRKPSAK